jgi:hypothetical protein
MQCGRGQVSVYQQILGLDVAVHDVAQVQIAQDVRHLEYTTPIRRGHACMREQARANTHKHVSVVCCSVEVMADTQASAPHEPVQSTRAPPGA